jgi:hypothetical protein
MGRREKQEQAKRAYEASYGKPPPPKPPGPSWASIAVGTLLFIGAYAGVLGYLVLTAR